MFSIIPVCLPGSRAGIRGSWAKWLSDQGLFLTLRKHRRKVCGVHFRKVGHIACGSRLEGRDGKVGVGN